MGRAALVLVVLLGAGALSAAAPPRSEQVDALERRLLRGWNTWNNPSVLSHVLMPEGLALNLTFRKKRGAPYWLCDSYISNLGSTFSGDHLPGAPRLGRVLYGARSRVGGDEGHGAERHRRRRHRDPLHPAGGPRGGAPGLHVAHGARVFTEAVEQKRC